MLTNCLSGWVVQFFFVAASTSTSASASASNLKSKCTAQLLHHKTLAGSYSQAHTFWEREDLGVHLIAELFVGHHVFVIVGAQQRVVSHHLVMDGDDLRVAAVALCTAHPQRVRVLLVAHRGHILPDVAQGATAVLSPHKLKTRSQLHCQNQNTFILPPKIWANRPGSSAYQAETPVVWPPRPWCRWTESTSSHSAPPRWSRVWFYRRLQTAFLWPAGRSTPDLFRICKNVREYDERN